MFLATIPAGTVQADMKNYNAIMLTRHGCRMIIRMGGTLYIQHQQLVLAICEMWVVLLDLMRNPFFLFTLQLSTNIIAHDVPPGTMEPQEPLPIHVWLDDGGERDLTISPAEMDRLALLHLPTASHHTTLQSPTVLPTFIQKPTPSLPPLDPAFLHDSLDLLDADLLVNLTDL
jgi:hypothetical protein